MQSRDEEEQLQMLLTICERIHEETLKTCPYSSNKHPELGYMRNSHFSHPHNLMRAAMKSRKRNVIEMKKDDKKTSIPAKEFVLKHMEIDLQHFPKSEEDDSLMLELNKRVLKLTDTQLMLYNLNEILDQSNILNKKIRKDTRPYTEKHAYEALAKNIHRFHIGNCADRAKFNIVAAIEFPIHRYELSAVKANANGITIEYFGLNGSYNHSFVVVNRDLNSDPNKPETWGKHAIIIDSWWNLHNKSSQQGVYCVAEEVKKYQSGQASSLFGYIMQASNDNKVSNYGDPPYYFGEGHTKEWQEKAKAGKRPASLCDYSDLDNSATLTQKPK